MIEFTWGHKLICLCSIIAFPITGWYNKSTIQGYFEDSYTPPPSSGIEDLLIRIEDNRSSDTPTIGSYPSISYPEKEEEFPQCPKDEYPFKIYGNDILVSNDPGSFTVELWDNYSWLLTLISIVQLISWSWMRLPRLYYKKRYSDSLTDGVSHVGDFKEKQANLSSNVLHRQRSALVQTHCTSSKSSQTEQYPAQEKRCIYDEHIAKETRRRCDIHINPMGIEEKFDSLPQLYPPLCVIEDYYVRDSTYIDGDNTKQRNKYENAKRISVEDMIGNLTSTSNKRQTTNNNFQVLTGQPGSGKTVLTKRIAKLSIEKGLKTWLLNLEDYSEDDHLSVEDLVISSYLGNNTNIDENDIEKAYKLIQDHQDQCLVVLDGLDRATYTINDRITSQIITSKTKLPPSKLFSLLCSRYFLPGVRLILSSRPHSIVSFPPRIRPDRVVFVNDLLEEDVNKIGNYISDGSNRVLNLLKKYNPEVLPLTSNPLFLYLIITMYNENVKAQSVTTELLPMIVKWFMTSRHYSFSILEKGIEQLEKMVLQKTLEGSTVFKKADMEKYELLPQDVQNFLYPVIENEGRSWYRLIDNMLVFRFAHGIFQEWFSVKSLIESSFDYFTKVVDNQLFPQVSEDVAGKLKVVTDNLSNLRNILCKYTTNPSFPDDKKDYLANAFAGRIEKIFGRNVPADEEQMKNLMKNITDIADDKMSDKISAKSTKVKFRFDFSKSFTTEDKEIFFKFFQTMVTMLDCLKLNCVQFDENEIDQLFEILQSTTGKIEDIHITTIDKLPPRSLQYYLEDIFSKVNKITLETSDRLGYETLKTRSKEFGRNRLNSKELHLELRCPGFDNYKLNLTKGRFQNIITKSKEEKTNINSGTGSSEILKQIKNAVASEATNMLEGLNCDIDGNVLPELKFVDDFSNEEIFEYDDRDVYDMEAYPKSKVVDVDELSKKLNSGGNMSICLSGAKGSGKTVIANRMIAQFSSNEKWSILINLDYLNKDKTTSLKEVLIDNFATKHGVFDKQECEKAFQWIVENPSQCNIFLDNYDRASFKLTTSSPPSVNDKMKPGELFGNLFAKLLLPEANILLISRPYAITQLPSDLRPKCPDYPESPISLYFVGNFTDEAVKILFNRFCGKQRVEKRNYIDQHFPLAWKLCRNPQMLHILANLENLDQTRNFFDLIDEVCFQFNGDDQESREDYLVMNSNKLKYLAYTASSDSSITLITDAASKNIQAVEGMMLVKPYENKQQTNKSYIQSHFINPLIQDHYTARYLKEGAPEKELKEFVDEKLFPLSAEKDGNCERFRLIRRFCCSNREGRSEINKYFWTKMREAIVLKCESQSISGIEADNLVLDLVNTFTEKKRIKNEIEQRSSPVHEDENSIIQFCNEVKKMSLIFDNLNFDGLYQLQSFCKLNTFSKFDVQQVNISTNEMTDDRFRTICSTIKRAKLNIKKLSIGQVENLEIPSLRKIRDIFHCIEEKLMIDVHDPGRARDLYDHFRKGFSQKQLEIVIQDKTEGRYAPIHISKRK